MKCLFKISGRKIYAPVDKNANTAFINMEGGTGKTGNSQPTPAKPVQQPPSPGKPQQGPSPNAGKPQQPPQKPEAAPTKPVQPVPITVKPSQLVTPQPQVPQTPKSNAGPSKVPSRPTPSASTPGPGSVKQLVNFYDSQGKHSVIRPYSYSEAVNKG